MFKADTSAMRESSTTSTGSVRMAGFLVAGIGMVVVSVVVVVGAVDGEGVWDCVWVCVDTVVIVCIVVVNGAVVEVLDVDPVVVVVDVDGAVVVFVAVDVVFDVASEGVVLFIVVVFVVDGSVVVVDGVGVDGLEQVSPPAQPVVQSASEAGTPLVAPPPSCGVTVTVYPVHGDSSGNCPLVSRQLSVLVALLPTMLQVTVSPSSSA